MTPEEKEIWLQQFRNNLLIGTATVFLSDLPKLKKAYNKAVKNNKDEFFFMGNQLVTKYAKYLIEFTEMKLKQK